MLDDSPNLVGSQPRDSVCVRAFLFDVVALVIRLRTPG